MSPRPKNEDTSAAAVAEQPESVALAAPSKTSTALVAGPQSARGKENFDSEDLILPRIALAQRTSPQIDESQQGSYIEGLKLNQMFNTLTKENLGNGPIKFTVLGSKKRAMEFDAQGKVVDFDVPLDDERLEFGPNGEKPVATLMHEFIVMLVPSGDIAVISFRTTQLMVGKTLQSLVTFMPGDSWNGLYELKSAAGKSKSGHTHAQYVLRPLGKTDDQTRELAEVYYNILQTKTVKVDDTSTGDTDSTADDVV